MYPKGKIIVIGHSVITENHNKEKFAFRKEENNKDYRTGFKTLAKAVLSHQNDLGLSVCGGMSVIIEKGFRALCKGNGSAMIVNAKEVSAKSIKPFKRGVSVYVKNLKGHILVDGCAVDLLTGERITPQIFDYSLNFMSTNNIN